MSCEESEKISVLTERIDHLIDRLDRADEVFVTQSEFWPVRTLVYGGVGIVLMAVMTATVALVVRVA